MMKNAFYVTSKVLFVLKIFKFFLDFLVMYRTGLINFKFYGVPAWLTNNFNTHDITHDKNIQSHMTITL